MRFAKPSIWFILLIGLLARLAAVQTVPVDSDLWRYMWEGDLVRAGGDPWVDPPSQFRPSPLIVSIHENINHPEIPAIYPGGTIGIFTIFRWFGLEALGFRLVFVLFDLFVAFALLLLSPHAHAKKTMTIAWLNPLSIYEVAGRGHFDSMLGACLLGGVLAMGSHRFRAAGIWLGVAIQIKTVAGLLLVWTLGICRVRLAPILVAYAMLVNLAVLIAFPSSFLGVMHTSIKFVMEFQSDDFIPAFLQWCGLGWGASRIVAVAVLFGATIWIGRSSLDHIQKASHALFWLLACMPTFHAWYVLWLLPFAALRPRPWLLVFQLSAFAYEFGHGGSGGWEDVPWVRWVVWAPVLAFYLADPWLSMSSYRRWMNKLRLLES